MLQLLVVCILMYFIIYHMAAYSKSIQLYIAIQLCRQLHTIYPYLAIRLSYLRNCTLPGLRSPHVQIAIDMLLNGNYVVSYMFRKLSMCDHLLQFTVLMFMSTYLLNQFSHVHIDTSTYYQLCTYMAMQCMTLLVSMFQQIIMIYLKFLCLLYHATNPMRIYIHN